MGTPFDNVYDRALTTIQDYHLDKIAKTQYDAFIQFMEGVLLYSIPFFDKCKTSLSYDIDSKSFNETLSDKEVNILAEIMVTKWFEGKVQDVTQFEGKLSNREFKTFSEAQNLKMKSSYLDGLREKYRQDITEYSLLPQHFADIFNIIL